MRYTAQVISGGRKSRNGVRQIDLRMDDLSARFFFPLIADQELYQTWSIRKGLEQALFTHSNLYTEEEETAFKQFSLFVTNVKLILSHVTFLPALHCTCARCACHRVAFWVQILPQI